MGQQDARVQTFDPNQPWMVKHQTAFASLLGDWLSNPQSFLNAAGQAPTNYSAGVLGQVNPALLAMLNTRPALQNNPFSELRFNNEFNELSNPYGGLGAVNQAFQTLAAASPIFDRNLKQANTNLATTAPGRFSSAIAAEGADVNSRALQDFNLFANEALMQGLGLQQQGQQADLNFILGARGLQQDAVGNTRDAQIKARGLQQDAEFTARDQNITSRQNQQANALAAAGVLGQIAQNAGQFGLDLRGIDMGALIALLTNGSQFNKPSDREAVVVPGKQGVLGDILKGAITLLPWILSQTGNGGNKTPTAPNQRGPR